MVRFVLGHVTRIILFVQRGVNLFFLGCAQQIIKNGLWAGSDIDYHNQDALAADPSHCSRDKRRNTAGIYVS